MNYTVKNGWKLNPNEKVVTAITKALERNNGKCPCIHEELCEDTTCPCTDYRLKDKCCCQLYVKI